MISEQLRIAINKFIETEQIKRTDIAKALGVSLASVCRFLKNGEIKSEKFEKFITHYNISLDEYGKAKRRLDMHQSIVSFIPILNYVQAGQFSETNNYFDTNQILPVFLKYKGCFALYIKGDSMTPKYRDGDLIVVDPDRQPTSGDDVIAYIENYDKATFKRYRERYTEEGQQYFELYPLNPDYPTFSSRNMEIAIRGVKIGQLRFD